MHLAYAVKSSKTQDQEIFLQRPSHVASKLYIYLRSVGSFCIGIPNRFPYIYSFLTSLRGQNMLDIISSGQNNVDCTLSSCAYFVLLIVLESSELKVVQLLYLGGFACTYAF